MYACGVCAYICVCVCGVCVFLYGVCVSASVCMRDVCFLFRAAVFIRLKSVCCLFF